MSDSRLVTMEGNEGVASVAQTLDPLQMTAEFDHRRVVAHLSDPIGVAERENLAMKVLAHFAEILELDG